MLQKQIKKKNNPKKSRKLEEEWSWNYTQRDFVSPRFLWDWDQNICGRVWKHKNQRSERETAAPTPGIFCFRVYFRGLILSSSIFLVLYLRIFSFRGREGAKMQKSTWWGLLLSLCSAQIQNSALFQTPGRKSLCLKRFNLDFILISFFFKFGFYFIILSSFTFFYLDFISVQYFEIFLKIPSIH